MTQPERPRPKTRPGQSSARPSPTTPFRRMPTPPKTALHAEDKGYHKSLKPRQVQMIAIGGAIGTGLFMGAGGRLDTAGPALVISYAVCGFFAFMILRALGELVMHRPSSGSFVSYAREFFGEKAAFVTGWLYWLNWAITAIVDITAVALYMNFFGNYGPPIADVPQWAWALAALILVLGLNLISVKVFGEMEFWFALIKVVALVAFLLVGIYFVIFGTPVPGQEIGFSLITDNGGIFPNGLLPQIMLMQGVLFAYASIELDRHRRRRNRKPRKDHAQGHQLRDLPHRRVLRRIRHPPGPAAALHLLQKGVSPFVTFFGSIGIQGVDVIMNLVVLTAALSSLNAGLYSTGRIMRSMSVAGSAPKFAQRMNKAGVPYGGIAITAGVSLLGVPLNSLVPSRSLRDRPERRLRRHHRHLGHDRPVPDPTQTLGRQGLAQTPLLQDVRRPLHRLPLPALPHRRARHGLHRLTTDTVGHPHRHRPHGGRLVRLPQTHPRDRRSPRRLHRHVPRHRQPAHSRRRGPDLTRWLFLHPQRSATERERTLEAPTGAQVSVRD